VIASVLADFHQWLTELAVSGAPRPGSAPVAPAPDLHALLGQMIALRQEVTLQTRAARSQQELNAETLRQLTAALELLQRPSEASAPANGDEEKLRPLLKALVDARDALATAEREVVRVQEAALPRLKALLLAAPPAPPAPPPAPVTLRREPSWWARWFGRSVQPAPAAPEPPVPIAPPPTGPPAEIADNLERVRQAFDSLVAGYAMSLQRLERALEQHGLEPIPAAGALFDPEQMEVLEVVVGSGRPAGEVLEEVRRGYRLHGRVFRYAQVRVARS
jgi:molecular chaperone GrpE